MKPLIEKIILEKSDEIASKMYDNGFSIAHFDKKLTRINLATPKQIALYISKILTEGYKLAKCDTTDENNTTD